MNIVIGGLGFIGNELVRQLQRQPSKVMIVDNQNRVAPRIEDIQPILRVKADITDYASLREIFQSQPVHTVFHLAAIHYIPECNENPERTLRINVEGTQSVLRAAAETGVKKVIFASSGAVYADSPDPLKESSSIAPVDIYGWSKWFGEQLCHFHHEESGLPVVIARLFNNYGPRETNPHIIPEILNQLKQGNRLSLGKITTVRDYIHTSDCAQALIRLAAMHHAGVQTVNVATGQGYTVMELIKMIGELTQRALEINHDSARVRKFDKQAQVADITSLKKLTGWQPTMEIRPGLTDLLKFEGLL